MILKSYPERPESPRTMIFVVQESLSKPSASSTSKDLQVRERPLKPQGLHRTREARGGQADHVIGCQGLSRLERGEPPRGRGEFQLPHPGHPWDAPGGISGGLRTISLPRREIEAKARSKREKQRRRVNDKGATAKTKADYTLLTCRQFGGF